MSRSSTLTNRLGARIAGARTLTVGELIGFAVGVAFIVYGDRVGLSQSLALFLGLATILVTMTAF